MKGKPLVSIIINNYNYGRFIQDAINSALNQTYPHVETIVVDDGSTDNSCELITSYKDRIVPVLKENGGQASAFNAGFATSKGDIICFLDSDDIFLPEKVAKVVDVFENYQDIGWCFHSQKVVDVNTGALLRLTRESGSREWDLRGQIRRGKEPFIVPATSGLCFTRSLMLQIFPLPQYENLKTAADRHLKFMTLALSTGFFLDEELSIQNVHGNNAYTAMQGKQQLRARGFTLTADWMRGKLPETRKFTNKLFAKGLSLYWRIGEVEPKSREHIQKYLSATSPIEKLEILLRAFYYRLRLWEKRY